MDDSLVTDAFNYRRISNQIPVIEKYISDLTEYSILCPDDSDTLSAIQKYQKELKNAVKFQKSLLKKWPKDHFELKYALLPRLI